MSEPDTPSLDSINRRLAEIDAVLEGDSRDPSREHYLLLVERDRLRAQASRYTAGRDASRSTSQLRAELEALRRQLKSRLASHTGYVTSKGGGSHSPSPGAWLTLASRSRMSSGMEGLQSRIGEIESELERREAID